VETFSDQIARAFHLEDDQPYDFGVLEEAMFHGDVALRMLALGRTMFEYPELYLPGRPPPDIHSDWFVQLLDTHGLRSPDRAQHLHGTEKIEARRALELVTNLQTDQKALIARWLRANLDELCRPGSYRESVERILTELDPDGDSLTGDASGN
jgi:hypothetical protein